MEESYRLIRAAGPPILSVSVVIRIRKKQHVKKHTLKDTTKLNTVSKHETDERREDREGEGERTRCISTSTMG